MKYSIEDDIKLLETQLSGELFQDVHLRQKLYDLNKKVKIKKMMLEQSKKCIYCGKNKKLNK